MKTYMTAEEVQAYFGIEKSTLYEWRKMGLRINKVKSKVFYKDVNIEEFLDGFEECEYRR